MSPRVSVRLANGDGLLFLFLLSDPPFSLAAERLAGVASTSASRQSRQRLSGYGSGSVFRADSQKDWWIMPQTKHEYLEAVGVDRAKTRKSAHMKR